MVADNQRDAFWAKATENLASAGSEYVNGRYNASANRSYFACFQAAIVALLDAGITARTGTWGHGFVQAQFVGQLIGRRKIYRAEFRDMLIVLMELRHKADYEIAQVSQREASRAVRQAESFLDAVAAREGGRR
jgi:uncharacterized protein (UPF0332 family)